MGKFLLASVALVLFVSCTRKSPDPAPAPSPLPVIGCSVEQSVTSAMAAAVASSLNCSALSVIQADIQAALGKADLCVQVATMKKPTLKGMIGDMVCPLAVSSVMGLAAGKVPATWVCDPSAQVANFSAMLSAACSKIVGI